MENNEIQTINLLLHLLRYATETIQIAEKYIDDNGETADSVSEILADLKSRRDNIDMQRGFILHGFDQYMTVKAAEIKGLRI